MQCGSGKSKMRKRFAEGGAVSPRKAMAMGMKSDGDEAKIDPKERMGTPEWRKEQLLNLIPGRRTYERMTRGK